MYLCDITGLHKKFSEILNTDIFQSFQICTNFTQFLMTDIHVIFKAKCITFFYFLFFFSCFFCSFVSSLIIFSLFFFFYLLLFFVFFTLYVVIKIVKIEKYMRIFSNATLLSNNIQDIVKELNYTFVKKLSLLLSYI
jgi:hypothetical protein